MKTLTVLTLLFLSVASFAQDHFVKTVAKTREENIEAIPARDFWLAVPQNYQGSADSKKDFDIFITAPKNTTANIQINGKSVVTKDILAGQVLSLRVFASEVELNSSDSVESEKAIHVWSDDTDLSVYFMSRNFFTSDGMYCIPVSGWGNEYVVASCASLLYGGQGVDLPSEFVVVASEDNTEVAITPTQDIRRTNLPDAVAQQKNVPFTVMLNRGECVQFEVTRVQNEQWDLTGTLVSATHPVGVIGASQCAFVPPSDPYCDHILDMIPPVRTWGRTYYSLPFAGRIYGGDSFLIIGSRDGQIIYRNGTQFAALSKYGRYVNSDISEPSVWTSSEAFMVVQYINSATHAVPQGSPRNTGDPSMVVLNSAEQSLSEVLFQIPVTDASSGHSKFSNFVNVLLPASSEVKTRYDGHALDSIPNTSIKKFPVSGTNWEGIRITYTGAGTGEGSHTITSDTGIGCYVYGYTSDESYAWSGQLGEKTLIFSSVEDAPMYSDLPTGSDEYTHAIERISHGAEEFFVQSVSPNPASGSVGAVRFVYAVKEPMPLLLEVYDMLGRKAGTVVSSPLHPQGVFEVFFPISDLPGGSYMYRLTAEGQAESGKFVITR